MKVKLIAALALLTGVSACQSSKRRSQDKNREVPRTTVVPAKRDPRVFDMTEILRRKLCRGVTLLSAVSDYSNTPADYPAKHSMRMRFDAVGSFAVVFTHTTEPGKKRLRIAVRASGSQGGGRTVDVLSYDEAEVISLTVTDELLLQWTSPTRRRQAWTFEQVVAVEKESPGQSRR
jgi:hypothetical protein